MKAILFIVALALAGVGAWGWKLHSDELRKQEIWNSEPEQLKRACVSATWEKLVAPSTAKLVDFRLIPNGGASIIGGKLQAAIVAAQANVAKADEAEKKFRELSQAQSQAGERLLARVKKGEVDPDVASHKQLQMFEDILELTKKTFEAENIAAAELKAATGAKEAYDAMALAEVALSFDSQNRSGAFLRMESVCTYKATADMEAELASLQLAKVDERGS